ncbi:MAG TPA: RlmE family RNA methyltransferase [Polyangiaceae bacterium]|nr:RlmE family RNA methyltransferase [Polyangiaceae bacterium]
MARNPYRRPDHRSRQAREQGYPARSIFKLEEIDRRVQLLRPAMRVLDLGAAPGSWSMYASQRVGPIGRILAIDLQPIDYPLGSNVTFLQGDALALQEPALATFAPYDVVLSDMAPNTTGCSHVDEIRSADLFMRAVDVAAFFGCRGSAFVGKLFMGATFEQARQHLRERFNKVRIIRPEGTRRRSVETFLIGIERK